MNIGTAGTVYLRYDSLHYNCVITIRANPTGAKTYMEAGIRGSDGGDWFVDADSYAYYAGPEIVQAYASCVDWAGQIGAQRRAMYNSHCAAPQSRQ